MDILYYITNPVSNAFRFILKKLKPSRKVSRELSLAIVKELGDRIINSNGSHIPTGIDIEIKIRSTAKNCNLDYKSFYSSDEILIGIYNYVDTAPGLNEEMKVSIMNSIYNRLSKSEKETSVNEKDDSKLIKVNDYQNIINYYFDRIINDSNAMISTSNRIVENNQDIKKWISNFQNS